MSPSIDFKQIGILSLYGLGMVWSPIFGTSEAVIFASLSAFPDALFLSRIVNLVALAIAMAVLAIAGDRLYGILDHAGLIAVTAIVGAVGMLMGSLVGMGVLPLWCLYPGAAARGVFWGVTTVLWINVFVHLEERSIGAIVSAALVIYAIAGFAILGATLVHPALAVVFLTACPLLSCFGCVQVKDAIGSVPLVDSAEATTPKRTRILLYVANFLFGIMLGALLYYFALYDTPASVAAFLFTSAAMFVVFSVPNNPIGLRKTLRVFMMCFAIAVPSIILMGWMSQEVATVVASGVLAIIILYTIVIFTDTQARLRKPFWRIPGMTQVFATAGMIIAGVAFHLVFPQGDIPDSYLVLLSAACMLFVASLFLPSAQVRVRPWGFSSLMPEESSELKMLRRCGELADKHNLTSRELEILQQLASGATREDIATALFISPATVKTHIRNIYAKLEVHSQGELLSLIEK